MKEDKKNIKITIDGMSCGNCAAGIQRHLENKGFENINVNFSTKEASCNIKNNQTIHQLEEIIIDLGYTIISKQEKKKLVYQK